MAMHVFVVFIIMVASFQFGQNLAVRIEIIPSQAFDGSQIGVNVSCVPDNGVTGIKMIQLYKNCGKDIVQLLPGRDVIYGPDAPQVIQASGHVGTQDGESSFLSITIWNPSTKDHGMYTCNLYHLDSQGVLHINSDTAPLTVNDDRIFLNERDIEADQNRVDFTLEELDAREDEIKTLSITDGEQTRISFLEENVAQQADIIKHLADANDVQTTELEDLREKAKNNTERIRLLEKKFAYNTERVSFLKKRHIIDNPWTMVFRATAGIGVNVLDAWNKFGHWDNLTAYTTEDLLACSAADRRFPCNTHLRSAHLDNWENIKKVKLALYTNGKEVFYITFRADGTINRNEFFDIKRVTDSSVPELVNYNGEHNYFKIDGIDWCERRFYINKNWGGCHNDKGWLMINDDYRTHKCCSFDHQRPHPVFYYTKSKSAVTWIDERMVGKAHVLAVWVKFNK